ncbi:MAG: carboxypeptidase regulatory-like domain-containing protein, partial [Cyclobacteriaceae bacterium]
MRYLISLLWIFISWISVAQQATIAGIVVDQTGEPLIGATVIIHELDRGITTDIDGRFSFANMREANYHLHVS